MNSPAHLHLGYDRVTHEHPFPKCNRNPNRSPSRNPIRYPNRNPNLTQTVILTKNLNWPSNISQYP